MITDHNPRGLLAVRQHQKNSASAITLTDVNRATLTN